MPAANRHLFNVQAVSDKLHIVRDDLIPGGSKRRGLDLLLAQIHHTDISYAGTIFGHGALALALAGQMQGKRIHLFVSANDPDSPMLARLADANAVIHSRAPTPIAELDGNARDWAHRHGARHLAPAFDEPDFHGAMVLALKEFDAAPYSEIWCASVSGTFARCLKAAFPETLIRAVSVVKNSACEFTAPEKYHRPAAYPPPYPACPFTDAKVWQFAKRHAAPGALIWTVAG